MENFNREETKQSLINADLFVQSLIDTIPPKLYFDDEIQEILTAKKHATMDEKELKDRRLGQKQLSTKNKHKRARLDPGQQKSVSQIQKELMSKAKKPKKNISFASETITRAANIEDLQLRIQERLKKFQEKRKGCTGAEFLEKKQMKNKLKLKKRQKGNTNKVPKDKPEAMPTKKNSPKKQKPEEAKKLYNKSGKIIYSKFDFTNDDENNNSVVGKAKQKGPGKDYKKLLEQAESKKERLDELRQKDKQKAELVEKKDAWHRVIQMAEGTKLKDDPMLLKKSLKIQEKKKLKSAKQWKERVDHTEQKKKARQDKRARNIKEKKEDKKNRKLKFAKKKGRIIPGF